MNDSDTRLKEGEPQDGLQKKEPQDGLQNARGGFIIKLRLDRYFGIRNTCCGAICTEILYFQAGNAPKHKMLYFNFSFKK